MAILVLSGVLAVLAAAVQHSPSPGQWPDDCEVTLEGLAYGRPYAMTRYALEVPAR